MHQNALLPDKTSKKFYGEGISPPQTPPPTAPRLSRFRRSTFPFLFIYDSNTEYIRFAAMHFVKEESERNFFNLPLSPKDRELIFTRADLLLQPFAIFHLVKISSAVLEMSRAK